MKLVKIAFKIAKNLPRLILSFLDWIVTRKPVILAPFDFKEYLESSRKLNFDYDYMEGIRANDWGKLLQILRSESYYTASEAVLAKFAEFSGGGSVAKSYLSGSKRTDEGNSIFATESALV